MDSAKGGRPAHHEGEVKKAAIAVRTAPSVRDALKRLASESGRSVTQEVEARLMASLDRDGGQRSPETEQLLGRFAAEIAEIERATGARWHRHQTTAGAVKEMLHEKITLWLNPDPPLTEPVISNLSDRREALREQIGEVTENLRNLGIEVIRPARHSYGLLTGARKRSPEIGGPLNDLLNATRGRWYERHQVEGLDLPDPIKRATTQIIEHLERLDAQKSTVEREYVAALQPYFEADEEGRKLYRQLKHRALAQVENASQGE